MIDLGQYEPSLRARPVSQQATMSWTTALNKAAVQLGFYKGHGEVPDEKVETLKELAHSIRGTVED